MPEEKEKDVFDFTGSEVPVVGDKKDDEPKDDDNSQDDLTKDDKSEDKPEDDNQEQEVYEDEESYLAQFRESGLPEDIKTLNDAMDFAVDANKKAKAGEQGTQMVEQINNWLSSQGVTGGISALMSGNVNLSQFRPQNQNQQQTQPNNSQQQFQPNGYTPVLEAVMTNSNRGMIKSDDLGYYQGLANVVDQGIQPQFAQVFNALKTLVSSHQMLSKQVQDNNWRMQPKKIRENFNRQELDSTINSGMAGDYSSAAIYIAQSKNPALMQELFSGQSPDNKPQRKNLRVGGQKPRKHERQVDVMEKYGKFLNPDGSINNIKLEAAIPNTKKQIAVLKEIAKATQPAA